MNGAAASPPPSVPTAALCGTVIVVGLMVDQHVEHGQWLVDVVVWLLFAWLCWAAARPRRLLLLACLGFATAGEVFLSLVWGLYDYRLGNLPLFVPPGHAMLLLVGMTIAARAPERVVTLVPLVAAPVVAWQAVTGVDRLGVPLFAVLLLALWRGRARRLYAVMFVLAWTMELLGTWLGNWQWRAITPWLQLPAANPPLCAGAFYGVLDLLVMAVVDRGSARR